ncbi:hypothetical protein MB46_18645 [Arthrobacter alpinus]|uniref:hypothetical protein n=1 Tax=Arthrobacter alpinus TaxID=656366 RepID=UPI0006790C0A|nr:hypothetical protein [Arthrobacter alpinus]ALV47211.1 hypothetical protein MB46_18645 [Arthrobacter alpinus]
MNQAENNETLVKLLEHLLEAHREGLLSSEGLMECLKRELAMAEAESTTTFPTGIPVPNIGGEVPPAETVRVDRPELLARKTNLLLDAIVSESGERFKFDMVEAEAWAAGYDLKRTKWSMLANGQKQAYGLDFLHAIATVFGVDPDYLVRDDGELPGQVRTEMSRIQRLRLDEVRDYAGRALGLVVPEALRAINTVLRGVRETLD